MRGQRELLVSVSSSSSWQSRSEDSIGDLIARVPQDDDIIHREIVRETLWLLVQKSDLETGALIKRESLWHRDVSQRVSEEKEMCAVLEVMSLEEGSRKGRAGSLVVHMVRGTSEAHEVVVTEDHVIGDDVEVTSEPPTPLDQQLFDHIAETWRGDSDESRSVEGPAEKMRMGISWVSSLARKSGTPGLKVICLASNASETASLIMLSLRPLVATMRSWAFSTHSTMWGIFCSTDRVDETSIG
jgi:hypothetical protein